MPYRNELDVALKAVRNASLSCRDVRNAMADIPTMEKEDRSPVTLADFGNQALIALALHRAFPEIPIVGEEASEDLKSHPELTRKVTELVNRTSNDLSKSQVLEAIDIGARKPDFTGRFWTVDPIDGTKGFLRGNQYAVALALIENGAVELGVLGCPNFAVDSNDPDSNLGCLLYAIQGQGARIQDLADDKNDRPIAVDGITVSESARFCESFESAHAAHDVHLKISAELGISNPPLRLDSQVKYAAVARGDASIYLRLPRQTDYLEKIWDHAAGAVIVEAAGGTVTDFNGRPIDFSTGRRLRSNKGIVASNGHLHEKVLCAISQAMQGRRKT